jgi:hypothetical protein
MQPSGGPGGGGGPYGPGRPVTGHGTGLGPGTGPHTGPGNQNGGYAGPPETLSPDELQSQEDWESALINSTDGPLPNYSGAGRVPGPVQQGLGGPVASDAAVEIWLTFENGRNAPIAVKPRPQEPPPPLSPTNPAPDPTRELTIDPKSGAPVAPINGSGSQPPKKPGGGSIDNPEGGGPVTPYSTPNDEGASGPGRYGPRSRSRGAHVVRDTMPSPDDNSVGPRLFGVRQGRQPREAMPTPDDAGGGGPRSMTYMPNPEGSGSGSPRSRQLR